MEQKYVVIGRDCCGEFKVGEFNYLRDAQEYFDQTEAKIAKHGLDIVGIRLVEIVEKTVDSRDFPAK